MPKDLDSIIDYFINDNTDNINLWIIEQSEDNKRFNLGKLINIGYGLTRSENSTYMFHPVDYIPKTFNQYYSYISKIPECGILGLYDSKHGDYYYKACMYTNHAMDICNGYTNAFWGWGAEDDSFYKRLEIKKLNRLNIDIGPLHSSNENKSPDCSIGFADKHHEKNLNIAHSQTHDTIQNDGLSTLKFSILNSFNIQNNIKKITVEL